MKHFSAICNGFEVHPNRQYDVMWRGRLYSWPIVSYLDMPFGLSSLQYVFTGCLEPVVTHAEIDQYIETMRERHEIDSVCGPAAAARRQSL